MINCKIGEGFEMMDWSIRIDSIINGASVVMRMSSNSDPSIVVMLGIHRSAWLTLIRDDVFVTLGGVVRNRCQFNIDAPKAIKVSRLKRIADSVGVDKERSLNE
jgi:sRNA-binding carbon storage regulator CsrA